MWRLILIVLFSLLISACATQQDSPFELVNETEEKVVKIPHVNSESMAYLGEALLSKTMFTTRPAYTIRRGTTTIPEEGRSCPSIPPFKFLTDTSGFLERKYVSDDPLTNEDLLCTEPLKDAEVHMLSELPLANPYLSNHMICRDLINDRYYYVSQGVASVRCGDGGDWKLLRYGVFPTGSVDEVQKEVTAETDLKQELIYRGRVGDTIKLTYRKFKGDLANPSFTREVQFDLMKSSVIDFEEARIQVIEATTTDIRYEVKKPF